MSTYDNDRTEIVPDSVRWLNSADYSKVLNRHRARISVTQIYWSKLRIYSIVIGTFMCLSREIKTFGSTKHRDIPKAHILKPSVLDTKLLFHPKCRFKIIWNILIMFLLLYTATVLPYRVCFNQLQSPKWMLADMVIDLIFLSDVVINFNTAQVSISERLIYSRKEIAKNYLKSWFFIDFFSSIPIDFIISNNNSSSAYNKFFRIFRVSRIYRIIKILRLLKLMRFLKSEYLSSLAIKSKFDSTLTRILGFIASLAVIVHISGCIWYYLSSIEDDKVNSWIFRYKMDDKSDFDMYIMSIYFVFTTLTTVGYGDITPFTNTEKCFTIILMWFGAGFYSYLIGSLTSFLKSSDSASAKVKAKHQGFKEFSKAINLSPEISDRVKRFIKMNYHKSYTENVHIDLILKDLPSNIREKIMNHVNIGICKGIDFFKDKPHNFVNSIIRHLQLCSYTHKEILYEEHDLPEEVYFIKSGRVLLNIQTDLVFRIFLQGSYFGEIEIFEDTDRQSSAIVGSKVAEIYTLHKNDFLKILKSFPDINETTQNIAKIRKTKNEGAIAEALNEINNSSSSLKTDSLSSSSEENEEVNKVEFENKKNQKFVLRRNDTGLMVSLQNDTPFKKKNRELWENAIKGEPMRFGRSFHSRTCVSSKNLSARSKGFPIKAKKSFTNPVQIKRSVILKPALIPKVRSFEGFQEDEFGLDESPEKSEKIIHELTSTNSDSLFTDLSKRQDRIEYQVNPI